MCQMCTHVSILDANTTTKHLFWWPTILLAWVDQSGEMESDPVPITAPSMNRLDITWCIWTAMGRVGNRHHTTNLIGKFIFQVQRQINTTSFFLVLWLDFDFFNRPRESHLFLFISLNKKKKREILWTCEIYFIQKNMQTMHQPIYTVLLLLEQTLFYSQSNLFQVVVKWHKQCPAIENPMGHFRGWIFFVLSGWKLRPFVKKS